MMRARVAFSGAIHTATPDRERLPEREPLLLDDGRLVTGEEVV